MQLSRCEQEVVINFNVTEQTASVYCADPKYIRLMYNLSRQLRQENKEP